MYKKVIEIYSQKNKDRLFYLSFLMLCIARLTEKLAIGAAIPLSSNSLAMLFQIPSLVMLFPVAVLSFLVLSPRRRALVCVIGVTLIFTALNAHFLYLLWDLLFIIAACNCEIDIRKLAKISLVVSVSFILIGITLSLFGISDEQIYYRGGDPRYSLGFYHPNCLGQVALSVEISMLVIRFGKLSFVDLLHSLGLATLIMLIADSKTAAIGIISALFIFVLVQKMSHYRNAEINASLLAASALIAISTVSVVLMLVYSRDSALLRSIDVALSGRLEYPHMLVESVGIPMLGFDTSASSAFVEKWYLVDGVVPIDNAYCSLLINQGPIVFLLSIAGGAVGIVLSAKARIPFCDDAKLICYSGIILGILIGITETYVLDTSFMYFQIIIGVGLFLSTKPSFGLKTDLNG